MAQEPAKERVDAVTDPPPDLVGTDFEGRYRVDGRLGAGGVGVVYLATDLKLSRPVALKVLHEQAHATRATRMRFEREARALAAVSHPHVVGIIDFGMADATAYLVMELLEGRALNELLGSRAHLEPERAFRILRQILLGLASVHRHGLVHRDLKPANVFLQPLGDGTEHVKLLDFGLAKFLDPDTAENGAPITRFGEIFGTPGYLAPEQLAGAAIDARADIYAVGVVLFEMLAGRKPFIGESHELLRRQLVDPLPSINDVCPSRRAVPALEEMLKRMLAREPSGRYQKIDELSAAFEALPSPAVIELDGASSVSKEMEEAPTVRDAGSEARTQLYRRASRPPRRSFPDLVRAMVERIGGLQATKAVRRRLERSRHPMVAAAVVFVGFSNIVVLVALTAWSVFEIPQANERPALIRSGPAAKARSPDSPQSARVNRSEASAPEAKTPRGADLSSGGEAQTEPVSGSGESTVGTGKSESATERKKPPTVNPWEGAVSKNLGKVRRSVRDGQKMNERPALIRSGPATKASGPDSPQSSRANSREASAPEAKNLRGANVSSGDEARTEPVSGSSEPKGGTGKSGSAAERKKPRAVNPWAGAVPKNLGKVRRSVRDGQKMGKRTEGFLRQYNQARPKDPRGHLLLAAMFLNRNWVSDAIAQYALAFRIDPGCRGDPDMLRNLLRIVAKKNVGFRASGLIRRIYGSEALPALNRAIKKYKRDKRAVKRLRLLRASLVD